MLKPENLRRKSQVEFQGFQADFAPMMIEVNLYAVKQLKLKACGGGTEFIEYGGTSAFSSGDVVGFTERHATDA